MRVVFVLFCLAFVQANDELMGMIKLQSSRLAEISMASKTRKEMDCFKRTVCIVGATMDKQPRESVSPTTLAKGIDQFRKILELMVTEIQHSPDQRMEDYPNIHQVLGRFDYCIIFRHPVPKFAFGKQKLTP